MRRDNLIESLSPMSRSRPPAPVASQRLVGGESPTLPMITTRAPVEITKNGSEAVTVPRLELTVEKENGVPAQRVVLHDGDIARIGSHPSNHLVVTDPLVSRFHFCAKLEQGGWRLLDSGSLNGTRVSAVRIRDV